ncbi:MAG: hypothetical protein WBP45_13905 [Daejeonella sp.]
MTNSGNKKRLAGTGYELGWIENPNLSVSSPCPAEHAEQQFMKATKKPVTG